MIIYQSVFISCNECKNICLNDDDSVCVKCGSKDTIRLHLDNKVFKLKYGRTNYNNEV